MIERTPKPATGPPKTKCPGAAVPPREPSRYHETEEGTWLYIGPKSTTALTIEDGPPGTNPLPAGASEDSYMSWVAMEVEKEKSWTLTLSDHSCAPPSPIVAPWQADIQREISEEHRTPPSRRICRRPSEPTKQSAPPPVQGLVNRAQWWETQTSTA
jgi:hypothetical protein